MILEDIDSAIAAKDVGTRSGRWARNSLLVLRERWDPSTPPLEVRIGSDQQLSASELSTVTKAVQDATARVALLLLHQNRDQTRVTEAVLERSKLIPRSQSGNVIYFDFPPNVTRADIEPLPLDRIPHLAEQAVRELIENLPETGEDHRALDALPGRRVQIRSAVSTLARAVRRSDTLTMSLANRMGAQDVSVLTVEQAKEVPNLLRTSHVDTQTVTVEGLMDGMRTQRRLFFLIESEARGGQEYSGSLDAEQVDAVHQALGQQVIARLEKRTVQRADGSRAHPTYTLLDFEVPQQL